MTKEKTADRIGVAPIALLLSRGTRAADARVLGPGGTRLGVGDRWPRATADGGMTAAIEVHPDGVQVHLACREDGFTSEQWEAFDVLPNPVTVLGRSPLAWFLIEAHGERARAPALLDLSHDERRALQAHLAEPRSPRNTLTLFGVSGDVIRSVKVGTALDGLWRTLAEAVAATPACLPEEQILAALDSQGEVDTDIMFAQAMQDHLRPRSR